MGRQRQVNSCSLHSGLNNGQVPTPHHPIFGWLKSQARPKYRQLVQECQIMKHHAVDILTPGGSDEDHTDFSLGDV
jgi:hypothetical protein